SRVSTLRLAIEAGLGAIEDAGLEPRDIDGVVSFFHKHVDSASPRQLNQALNLNCNYHLFSDAGGSWSWASVVVAAMLVDAGICNNVLVYRAKNTYSEGRRLRSLHGSIGGGEDQFRNPFGASMAAATFGHPATAHMARYGTTTLDLAHLA